MLGIDALKHEVRKLSQEVDCLATTVTNLKTTVEALIGTHGPPLRASLAALDTKLGKVVAQMANGFDNLKNLIDQQGGVIAQEAGQINAKLDENNRLIEELKGQVGNDPRLQALADQIAANNQAIGGFIPDSVPEPPVP